MDLSSALPNGALFQVFHFRTPARECNPLRHRKPRVRHLRAKHLLLLADSQGIVLGVEAFVYLAFMGEKLEREIFVAKADTSGLAKQRISAAAVVGAFLSYLILIAPSAYFPGKWRAIDESREKSAERKTGAEAEAANSVVNTLLQLSRKVLDPAFYRSLNSPDGTEPMPVEMPKLATTKVAMFTRAANAYLFPGSEKNTAKHVADGNALFSWWLKVLDEVLPENWLKMADIPGSDHTSVARMLPRGWKVGSLHVQEGVSAVALIPLFPDDPKGRFLEHLVVENRYKGMDSAKFWAELGFRQEFRLGNVVGIIGCANQHSSVVDLGTSKKLPASVTFRTYLKIMELIKARDFSDADEVAEFVRSAFPDFLTRVGADGGGLWVKGTRVTTKAAAQLAEPKRPAVNVLTGVRKKKK